MRDVMSHFGHRYRTHGNMLCCWHDERRPSARLYDDQDTYWCWVCSPDHGVDILEFVIIELGLEADVDPQERLRPQKRRALSVLRAILYLEDAFDLSYASEPWEKKLAQALERKLPPENPTRYWHNQHAQTLRVLGQITDPAKWSLYATATRTLTAKRTSPIRDQAPLWRDLRHSLSTLK